MEKQKEQENHIRKIQESVVEEKKVFSRTAIIELIQQIAEQEGLGSDKLKIEGEVYNKDNVLVGLKMSYEGNIFVKKLNSFFKSAEYEYMIKGTHEGVGSSMFTGVAKVYHSDNPEETQGGIVAEYHGENDKWKISPDSISEKAGEIKLLDDN